MKSATFGFRLFVILCNVMIMTLSISCSKDDIVQEPPVPTTGVSSMYIELTGETIPGHKEDRKGCIVSILDENGTRILSSSGGIRLRGNGTRDMEKSPYDLKLIRKDSVLGMSKDKRWVLLANYWDRTSLRNDVGLEIARRSGGMAWNPKGEFVSLYYDGRYSGLYFLCEKIKISKERVNIDEMTADDIDEHGLTGGYLLEFDSYQDEKIYYTDIYRYPVKIKEPDDAVDVQAKYIMDYLNGLEAVLSDEDKLEQHLYEDYIDVRSFISWWLTGELVMCKDYNAPASVYMYKARSGKLFAGPIWDLDLYTFSSDVHDINSFLLDGSMYYSALLKDSKFRDAVKREWNEFKSNLEGQPSIFDYIDNRSSLIREEVGRDDALYPARYYAFYTGDEYLPFNDAVEKMKSFLSARIIAMDKLIGGL